MWVPDTTICRFRVSFDVLPLVVFLSRVSFEVLHFSPPMLQEFIRNIEATNLPIAQISRYVVVRGKLVIRRECDFFSYGEGTKEFASFKCPRLDRFHVSFRRQ